jgi:N-acyl-D-aspartate/D-glutamate deacylase
VIDPETNFDQAANVALREGRIAWIGLDPVRARETIDASGLIVAPGFIDLHSHGQTDENYRLKAQDGVTAALEMEVGVADVDAWYQERAGKALIHYGATAGHIPVRMKVMNDPGEFLPSGEAAQRAATEQEIKEILDGLRQGLGEGALGVGFGLQYTPGATRQEVLEAFRVAAESGAPAYVHLRYMGTKEGSSAVEALEEVLTASETTGAALHVVHVQSSGLRSTPKLLDRIAAAQQRGQDVTTECYPYPAAMTRIDSALFDPGWQDVLGISYPELLWAETGERLNEKTFAGYRKQGGMVIMFMIPEEIVDLAVGSPLTMIASDGVLKEGKGHPRGAGTYSRVLGRFVRERGKLTWIEALRKMTLAPAQRLEGRLPVMKNKGRLRAGVDADITIFDPEQILDEATFEEPARPSRGIRYVLINGTPVVFDGELRPAPPCGQGLRAAPP